MNGEFNAGILCYFRFVLLQVLKNLLRDFNNPNDVLLTPMQKLQGRFVWSALFHIFMIFTAVCP
jgi:hypothetical protein